MRQSRSAVEAHNRAIAAHVKTILRRLLERLRDCAQTEPGTESGKHPVSLRRTLRNGRSRLSKLKGR
jgi:hypothetical protein